MISRLIAQQHKGVQFGSELLGLLKSGDYAALTVVVAFVRCSGVLQIKQALDKFLAAKKKAKFIVGISGKVTSYEGLKLLLDTVKDGNLSIFHNANSAAGIFHPKMYFFEGAKKSALVIASNNLTEPGLFVNYELAVLIELNPQAEHDQQVLTETNEYIKGLLANADVIKPVTSELLEQLKESGVLETETKDTISEEQKEVEAAVKLEKTAAKAQIKNLFGSASITAAPKLLGAKPAAMAKPATKAPAAGTATAVHKMPGATLIMRPYPQRNGTQIQVPMIANTMYFNESSQITSEHNGEAHSIREAHSGGGVNTLEAGNP